MRKKVNMFCFTKEVGPSLFIVWDALTADEPVAKLLGGAWSMLRK